jgi:hypothetical protein
MLTPPTDNLYKFLAISGVLLVAVGLVGEFQLVREEDRQLLDLEIEHAGLAADWDTLSGQLQRGVDRLDRDLKAIASDHGALVKQMKAVAERPSAAPRDLAELRAKAQALTGRVEEVDSGRRRLEEALSEGWRQHEIPSAKHRAKARQLASIEGGTAKVALVLLQQAILWGAGIAVVGFVLWYLRVQRYLDREIRERIPGRGKPGASPTAVPSDGPSEARGD